MIKLLNYHHWKPFNGSNALQFMAYREDGIEKIIWFDYSNRTKTYLHTYKGRFGLNGKWMSWNSNNSKNEVFLNFKKGEIQGIKILFK